MICSICSKLNYYYFNRHNNYPLKFPQCMWSSRQLLCAQIPSYYYHMFPIEKSASLLSKWIFKVRYQNSVHIISMFAKQMELLRNVTGRMFCIWYPNHKFTWVESPLSSELKHRTWMPLGSFLIILSSMESTQQK